MSNVVQGPWPPAPELFDFGLLAEMAVAALRGDGLDELAIRREIHRRRWQHSTHWNVWMSQALRDSLS